MQKTEARRIRKGAKIKTARRLRKALTKPELWLWLRLKARTNNGLVFRNQHPLGPYILDFYCTKAKLCVEVDGEIHTHDHQRQHDEKRDAWLTEQGIHVHRVIARDLLTSPDETTQGIFDLALERLSGSPAHHASRGPCACESYTFVALTP
jgi:very-short-patch-repair endonuclease